MSLQTIAAEVLTRHAIREQGREHGREHVHAFTAVGNEHVNTYPRYVHATLVDLCPTCRDLWKLGVKVVRCSQCDVLDAGSKR